MDDIFLEDCTPSRFFSHLLVNVFGSKAKTLLSLDMMQSLSVMLTVHSPFRRYGTHLGGKGYKSTVNIKRSEYTSIIVISIIMYIVY